MLNIMQIEKSHFIINTVRNIVSEQGHSIISVFNTEEALNILETNDIDLVIAALAGNEVLLKKLNDSKFSNIPVLVLTATYNKRISKKLFQLGVLDYIVKNNLSAKLLKKYLLSFEKVNVYSTSCSELEIAVLDDSLFSLNAINKIFSNSSFTKITYFSKSKDLLQSEKIYPIYLIDLVLDEASGTEILLRLRERSEDTIIILISAIDDYKTISNILQMGANDYIVKPFIRNYFLARLNSHIRTYLLRRDLEIVNMKLRNIAMTDGLTGLYNHRFIIEKLAVEYERASRYNKPLSIAMIDIDHFKKFNDDYGHPVGDKVLIEFGRIMEKLLREADIIGRYGGEEFIIIFSELDIEQAYKATERIRKFIENHEFECIERPLTFSAGISDNTETLLDKMIFIADKKLYMSKEMGRNKTVK